MNIERATTDELYRLLLDVQDQLNELLADDRLTLARDSQQTHGTTQKAVGVALEHLDAARQVLAVLETADQRLTLSIQIRAVIKEASRKG